MRISVVTAVPPALERPRVLHTLADSRYDPALVEVLLAVGHWPSAQRNRALEHASGDIVVFLDDDSRVAPEYLDRVASAIQAGADGVGGPTRMQQEGGILQQAFGAALANPLGAGPSSARYGNAQHPCEGTEDNLILCNFSVRKELLDEKAFDERLYPNEENELFCRLRATGHRLRYDPEISVFRGQRRTLGAFAKQMVTYGIGRGKQVRIRPSFSGIARVIFAGAVLAAMVLGYAHYYAVLPLAGALWHMVTHRTIGIGILLLFLVPLMHVCYAIGIAMGLATGKGSPAQAGDPITVQVAKRFSDPWEVLRTNGSSHGSSHA